MLILILTSSFIHNVLSSNNQCSAPPRGQWSHVDRAGAGSSAWSRFLATGQLLPSISSGHEDKTSLIARELVATIDHYRDRFSLEHFDMDWDTARANYLQRANPYTFYNDVSHR